MTSRISQPEYLHSDQYPDIPRTGSKVMTFKSALHHVERLTAEAAVSNENRHRLKLREFANANCKITRHLVSSDNHLFGHPSHTTTASK